MEREDDIILAARAYLRDNVELRRAIGASASALLEPHCLGAGEHNVNYWFREPGSGRKYVLRVNVAAQPFHDNQVAYEFAALRALEESGCTPKPVFLDDSPAALGKGVIVESFCEGNELDFDDLRPGDLEAAIQLMADVHAVPVDEDCPLYRPVDPLRELFEECLQRFRVYRASAFEDARITKWVERFIAVIEPAVEASSCRLEDCRHIINTETLPSHFLISREGGSSLGPLLESDGAADSDGDTRKRIGKRAEECAGKHAGKQLGSFIDWERPIIGEVAQDVAYFVSPTTTFWDSEWLCPPDTGDRMVEEYWRAVDGRFAKGAFDERYPLYLAMTALRSTTWCCRALVHYSQAETHKTSKAAKKLPIYLSDDFLERLARDCLCRIA
jgi:aminoglycoside phosphotransferase (APT) family kinase protein